MKRKFLLLLLGLTTTVMSFAQVSTFNVRGMLRLVYGGDTLDVSFSGDTLLFDSKTASTIKFNGSLMKLGQDTVLTGGELTPLETADLNVASVTASSTLRINTDTVLTAAYLTPLETANLTVASLNALDSIGVDSVYVDSTKLQNMINGIGHYLPSGVQGDILYHNGTSWVVLNAGTAGYYLRTGGVGANPSWNNLEINTDTIYTNFIGASIAGTFFIRNDTGNINIRSDYDATDTYIGSLEVNHTYKRMMMSYTNGSTYKNSRISCRDSVIYLVNSNNLAFTDTVTFAVKHSYNIPSAQYVFTKDTAFINKPSKIIKLITPDLEVTGSQILNITTVNAATYDLLTTDYILNVTYTSTGAVTSLTLPTAQVVSGRIIIIKDAGGNATTNSITIDTEGSETIDGISTKVINSNYGSVMLYCDGNNWFVVAQKT